MFIVTVKNIDVDSFALPTLYGKTTLQKYNFSVNLQESSSFFLKKRKRKFKADIIGPNTQSGRFPAMSAGPARPTRMRLVIPSLEGHHLTPQSKRIFIHTHLVKVDLWIQFLAYILNHLFSCNKSSKQGCCGYYNNVYLCKT